SSRADGKGRNVPSARSLVRPTVVRDRRREQSHVIGLAPEEPPLRLMADKNSWRVIALVRNVPSMQLVTIVTSGLCTPLVVMHSCAASTTTPTPNGLSTLSRQAAISAVIFSCT